MSIPDLPTISTEDLAKATEYIDELVGAVREARSIGEDLDVERLLMLMLMGVTAAGTDYEVVIVQQALMLSIALQRLAS